MNKSDRELSKLYRIAAGQAATNRNLDIATRGVEGHGYPQRLSRLAIHRVANTRVKTRPKNP